MAPPRCCCSPVRQAEQSGRGTASDRAHFQHNMSSAQFSDKVLCRALSMSHLARQNTFNSDLWCSSSSPTRPVCQMVFHRIRADSSRLHMRRCYSHTVSTRIKQAIAIARWTYADVGDSPTAWGVWTPPLPSACTPTTVWTQPGQTATRWATCICSGDNPC